MHLTKNGVALAFAASAVAVPLKKVRSSNDEIGSFNGAQYVNPFMHGGHGPVQNINLLPNLQPGVVKM
jgi:hypothetical protein